MTTSRGREENGVEVELRTGQCIVVPASSLTRALWRRAERVGLNPRVSYAPYRGSYEVALDEGGPSGHFGVISVGAHSGRVLRATFCQTLGDRTRSTRVIGARAVARMLRELHETDTACADTRQPGGPAGGDVVRARRVGASLVRAGHLLGPVFERAGLV